MTKISDFITRADLPTDEQSYSLFELFAMEEWTAQEAAEAIKALGQKGVDFNAPDPQNDGKIPLALAAYYNNGPAFKALLPVTQDVNAADSYGNTTLIWATFHDSAPMIDLLRATPGISLNQRNSDERSAVMLGGMWGKDKAVQALEADLRTRLDITDIDDRTALELAVGHRKTSTANIIRQGMSRRTISVMKRHELAHGRRV